MSNPIVSFDEEAVKSELRELVRKTIEETINAMLDAAGATLSEGGHPVGHTDRECHYRWPGWIERCERYGITRSMSKKGCSPDNSACEGFFGRLKVELFYGRNWSGWSVDDFMGAVDCYIHWYNERRIKESLEGMSPLQYRRSLNLAGEGKISWTPS